jgi:hypothetical protein
MAALPACIAAVPSVASQVLCPLAQVSNRGQTRICAQDPLMQFPQLCPWLGAQLLDQDLAGVLVGGQCLGLAAAPVKGQHQLGVETLPQRMLGGQGLEPDHQLIVAAQVQPGVGVPLQGLQPRPL